ncbi:MAG: hypothetical protein AAB657_04805 [Patescibacteria group bacterium]
MKKYIIIASIVIIAGGSIGYLIYQKKHTQKEIKYPGEFTQDRRCLYVVDDKGDPTTAKNEVLENLKGYGAFINHIIWVTSQPESYPKVDPYDSRIKYHTTDSVNHALTLIKEMVLDSNWIKTTSERLLFHSFEFTEEDKDLAIALERDTITTATPMLAFGFIRSEREKIKTGKKN